MVTLAVKKEVNYTHAKQIKKLPIKL